MTSRLIHREQVVLSDDNLPIIWVSEINTDAASNFGRDLLRFESDSVTSEIFVYITSYGGEIYPLLMMMDMIENCSKSVHTVCVGMAISCGAFLLMSNKGKRWMSGNSYALLHPVNATWTHSDTISSQNEIDQIKHTEKRIFDIVAKRSGKLSNKDIMEKLREQSLEWQLTAEEALSYGLIDKIGIPKIKKYLVTEYE